MALVSLMSAKGAPGCTTTTLGLALLWPTSSILVEADLSGSSVLAGYLRGELHPTMGLVEVATTALQGRRLEAQTLFEQALMLERSRPGPATTMVVPGITNLAQAPALRSLWGELGSALRSLQAGGVDALVDVGRLGVIAEERHPLLTQSDLLVVLTGSSLPQIHATQQLVAHLQKRYTGVDSQLSPLALVVIGPDRPYSETEIAASCGIRLLGSLPWDSETAATYSVGAAAGRKPQARPLNRCLAVLAEQLRQAAATRRAELTGSEPGGAA